MSNRLGEFFRGIKTSAEKIKASVEKAGRVVQGLDPDESLHYGGYTLTVGQKFGMWRLIDGTGQQYISEGKIVGFRKNDVVIERYSLSEERYIFEAYSIEKFVRKINRGEITGISKDPNPAEVLDEEIAARNRDQEEINKIARSIKNSGGAEAGVETPREETAEIYHNTKGIETYTTPDGEAIACYTSKYKRERQEDRAVVGAREIGGRVVKLMCAIDGVGGSFHGDFAAQAFAESIQEAFNELENLPVSSGQGSLPEWEIIQDSLIIPAMNKARKKIEAKALEAKKQGDSSYEKSSCVFTAVVIVGNKAYFYTVGDSIGTYFSLRDKTVTPYTTRVNVRIVDGQEYVSGYVGLGLKDIKPLADERTLEPGDVVGVFTDGITDNFRQRGRRSISESIHALLSREEPKIPTNIHDLWLRLEEKLYSLRTQREVTPSRKIARRILGYVKSLGKKAKEDNQTFMVYYHSGQPQTN